MNTDTGKKRKAPGKRKPVNKAKLRKRKIVKAKSNREKKDTKKFMLRLFCVLAVSITLAAAVLYLLLAMGEGESSKTEKIEAPRMEESKQSETDERDIGSDIISHIMTAGNAVEEAYLKRPESHELTAENTADFAAIDSCTIDQKTGKVKVTVSGDGIPVSDDKYYYLFAVNTFENSISEDSEYIAREYKDNTAEMAVALNYNKAGSRLFKKFVIGVKKDGKFVQVSNGKYITNPEAIAKYSSVYQTPASKKGLLVDPNKLRGTELDDLGVKQAAYNIPVARILGPTSNPAWPTINYTYNGKTYAFNGQVIAEYDLVFGTLTAKGISTTAIILNNYSSSYIQLIHPNARSGSTAPYYMFNGAEESGVDYMAAIGTFLAERYSDNKHGRVSNWIIANEINARKEWNYMAKTDIETYVEEYARGFRVFYTAIKSVSSSARVYMPIDQQWDRNIKNNTNYDGRDIVDVFNANISSKGNIDWGLAQHPYNVPLTEGKVWKASSYVEHNAGTSMITMANIEVLTNYMQQKQLLTESGEVRSIILSEQGYTSHAGEALQAASFAYAYYKTEANPHIDGYLLNRQTDAPEEVAQGLAFGLNDSGGRHKQIYTVFKYIDTPQHEEYTEFAKSLIGISSWNEIYR